MDEWTMETGFLVPVEDLSVAEIEEACEAAFENARDLLGEAELLRQNGHCPRAYFLAHVACEELGKLPILTTLAVALRLGHAVDWRRIDRALRSHRSKVKQVLFMDSIVGGEGLAAGKAAYEADVRRMRMYMDMKNASLYSFNVGKRFGQPRDQIPCEIVDPLLGLARGRCDAFEAMYIRPIRERGGLDSILSGPLFEHSDEFLAFLTGDEGRKAFEEYERTRDESVLAGLFERALKPFVDEARAPADDDPT